MLNKVHVHIRLVFCSKESLIPAFLAPPWHRSRGDMGWKCLRGVRGGHCLRVIRTESVFIARLRTIMAALQPDHRTFGAFQDLPFYPLQSRAPGPWLSTAIEFLELLYDQHGPGSPYLVQDLHRFSEIDRSYRLSAEKRGIEQWLPLLRMWRDEFTAGQMITPSMSGKLWQQIGVTASGKGHKDLCLPEVSSTVDAGAALC